MFERSFKRILERIADDGKVVIVGAGNVGRELASEFLDNDIMPRCFIDNNKALEGLSIYGIAVKSPCLFEEDYFYVISVGDDRNREELKEQIKSIGVNSDKILCYYPKRSNSYHRDLDESEYQAELSAFYRERHGLYPDLNNPKTYSEIINYEKLQISDDNRTRLTDKVLAKEWAAKMLGDSYVTKLYGVWEKAEDIDFDTLPDRFVLKANNGSGRNIIVDDKNDLDRDETIDKLNEWINSNFFYDGFERQYKDIKPRILAEEYLDGLATLVYDYNIFCFHGEPEYIWCIKGSHRPGCSAAFYDKEWKLQPFSYGYPLDVYPAPKPKNLDEMLEISRVLSKDYDHVRVDLYDMPDGRVLFGEMTFSTWGGLVPFSPRKFDKLFGNLIKG